MESNNNSNENKGYGGLPEIPVGSHLAMFFSDEDDLKDIVCPLMEREINKNRRVVYIRNGVDVEWIKDCLDNYNPEKHDRYLKAWTATDISLRRNGFTPRTLLEILQTESEKADDESLSGLTIMLEVTNVLMQLFLEGRFMDFFINIQDQLAMTTNRFIFEYNLSKLDKRVLHMIMTEHPCLLYDKRIEFNPFYTKKDESPANRFISHVKSLNLLKLENEGMKSKNQELQACKQKLEESVSNLNREMKDHEKELLRVKEENKQKVKRIERIQEQLRIDQREISEYKNNETALQEQLKRKIRSIEDLQKNFDIYKLRHSKYEEELEKRDEKIKSLTNDFSSKETELRERNNDLNQKEQQIDSLKERLETAQKERTELDAVILSYKEKSLQNQQEIELLKRTLNEKEERITSLKTMMEKQAENHKITEQAFEEYKEINSDLVRETESLSKQISVLHQGIEALEAEKKEASERLLTGETKMALLTTEKEQAQEELSKVISELNTMKSALFQEEKEKERLRTDYRKLLQDHMKVQEKAREATESLESQRASNQARIQRLSVTVSGLEDELQQKRELLETLDKTNVQLKGLLNEKEEQLNNKNRQIYRFSSLSEEFKQKASLLNKEKIRLEKKYTENMHKVSSSLKSIKAHHDLDKQKLEDAKVQVETLKNTVKRLTATNESLQEEGKKYKSEADRLYAWNENLEKQNTKLRDLLKSTNRNCSKIEEHNRVLKGELSHIKEQSGLLMKREKKLMEDKETLISELTALQESGKGREQALQKKIEGIDNALQKSHSENANLKTQLDNQQNRLRLEQQRIEKMTTEHQELEETLQKVKENETALKRELSDREQRLEHLFQEKEKILEKSKRLNEILSKRSEKNARLQKDIEEMKLSILRRDEKMEDKDGQIDSLSETLKKKQHELSVLQGTIDDMTKRLEIQREERQAVQETLNQQLKETDKLNTETKMLRLLIEEKEAILGKEMKNIIKMKDEIEHLKYEKLLVLREKDRLIKKFNEVENKFRAFGNNSSGDNLEHYRMIQISKSLSDNKPSE